MTTYVGTDGNDNAETSAFAHAVGLEGNDLLWDGFAGTAETLEGNEGHDYLYFDIAAAGSMYGGSGNDTLHGFSGIDRLYGGEGNDYIQGDTGPGPVFDNPDSLYGGGGTDGINGRHGDDLIYGGEGNDSGTFSSASPFTYLNDSWIHEGGLYGSFGDDQIYGGGGNDLIAGGGDDDQIDGGVGDDVINGGFGSDSLRGGGDGDRFVFDDIAETAREGSLADVIHDFDHNEGDLIDLSAIDARTGGADDPFDFIGAHLFSGHRGELRFKKGKLTGDVDGDGNKDFMIKFPGLDKMVAGDFDL